FFQAEDGIRDDLVTGVQTCALPIYPPLNPWSLFAAGAIVSLISLVPASSSLGDPSYLVTRANISFLPFAFDNRGKPTRGMYQAGTRASSNDAELVQRAMQIGRIAVHAERARRGELVQPVAAGE